MVIFLAGVFYYDYVTIEPWTYLLAVTNKGLAYVDLKGDETAPIFSYYPNKMLVHDPERLKDYVTELKEYFSGKRRKFDLPIDISEFGTPFQRQVLEAVNNVPYGMVVNYGDIASSLSGARSVRAVAHAIALNPVLLFIPCHRVVLSTGRIGGYRMGSKEKARLLNLEKSFIHEHS